MLKHYLIRHDCIIHGWNTTKISAKEWTTENVSESCDCEYCKKEIVWSVRHTKLINANFVVLPQECMTCDGMKGCCGE